MYPLSLIIKPPAFGWLKPVQLQVEQTIAYQSANLAAFCVNSPVFAVIDSFQAISYAFGLVEFVVAYLFPLSPDDGCCNPILAGELTPTNRSSEEGVDVQLPMCQGLC